MKLLTVENSKTTKGESLGYLTGILYLAPANESGVMDTCPMSTAGCRAGCLFTAGRASYLPMIIAARIRKTQWLHRDRTGFIDQLRKDVTALIKRAKRLHLMPAVRISGTSDLPQIALLLASEFPTVQFYDYTKIPRPWKRTRENYHLTFSLSESNWQDAYDALQHGVNVAVVFSGIKPLRLGGELPGSWRGFSVTDGDMHDLRFLDARKLGLIIGLRAKGRAKKDTHGFVQIAKLG